LANHPNRSRRLKSIEPPLGWTYGQFLPEITGPLIDKMRLARNLDKQLRELRREIHRDISVQWTAEEIEQAKKTVQNEYERATGRRLPPDPRMC